MDEDQETESCPVYHDKGNAGENKPVDIAKGRLYIKLKFPTAANRSNGEETIMHGDEQLETPQIRKNYVCDFCDKKFSSGKGLGGHKRVHTQASKRHHQFLHKKIHKPKFKESGGVDDRHHSKAKKDGLDATCVMCGKGFPSMKSLFGHMRSHPEREWRGIHPPVRSSRGMPVATMDSPSACEVRDQAAVDPDDPSQILLPGDNALLPSTSEWRITGKRRNKLGSMSSGGADVLGSPSGPVWSEWESTAVELEASNNLLLLAKGNHALSNPSSTSGPEGKSARGDDCDAEEVIKCGSDNKTEACTELVGGSKKQRTESSPPDKKVKRESSQADRAYTTTVREGKGKGKIDECRGCDDDDKGCSYERDDEVELNCEDGEYKVTQYQVELNILVKKGNIEKKKRKRLPRNSEAGADGIAWCSISHSRKISKTPERFKCITCNKSFTTHQALGGHMSSHNKVTIKKSQSGDDHEGFAPADQEADESAAATQEGEKDGGTDAAECRRDDGGRGGGSSRKMLVLDLNELPPIEEDKQEG